ncbi:unnamed protein product [Heterobilharzia americana]|nr:unnamed protein product [Heterobilharzia americana]
MPCQVIHNGKFIDAFEVKTRDRSKTRQGCHLLSPIIFLIMVDWTGSCNKL